MRSLLTGCGFLLVTALCASDQPDAANGLVLWYALNGRNGTTVQDVSGHGNDGKIVGNAQWADDGLVLDGATYVETGPSRGLELPTAGTLAIWCKPEAIGGGLISWHLGSRWQDARLVLGFITWYDSRLIGVLSDGVNVRQIRDLAQAGEWAQYVFRFDGANLQLFVNGRPTVWTPQEIMPNLRDVPLRIGVTDGLGTTRFRGLVRDVRVYNRALTNDEVAQQYRDGAKALGLSKALRVRLAPRVRAREGKLDVEADLSDLVPLAAGVRLSADLRDAAGRAVRTKTVGVPVGEDKVTVTFDVAKLSAGDYQIGATAMGPDGKPVGEEATAPWRCPKVLELATADRGARVLNNLVTELVNVGPLPADASREIAFENPRRGWIFISTTARMPGNGTIGVWVDAEAGEPVIRYRHGDAVTQETMRFLSPGRHALHIRSEPPTGGTLPVISRLVIRAVPAMIYCAFPAWALSGYGGYDFDFLRADVLPNINTIVGSGEAAWQPEQQWWKRRGGQWFLEQNIPTLLGLENTPSPMMPDFAADYWTRSSGFQNPYLDGVLADEFSGGNSPDFEGYMGAIKRIAADERYTGRAVNAWCGPMYVPSLARDFARTVIGAGYKIAWEVYLAERPTEQAARDYLASDLRREMGLWTDAFPGFPEDLIFVLGFESAPPETFNSDPQVDYKVFVDMQYHNLATAPEFFGLYGVMVYKSRYADEETIRWAGRLFRHYCIDGHTEPLSARYGFTYQLDHIQNADFNRQLQDWTVTAAQPDSVRAGRLDGLGILLGRGAAGDRYCWMKRSRKRPNVISQPIRNLRPGRLYSMKMIVADYGDVSQGVTDQKRLAISVGLDKADVIAEKSFVSDIQGINPVGPFAGKGTPWMNMHRIVFRPRASSSVLTIRDWDSAGHAGGPTGQELLLNFVEIQPYLDQ